MTQLHRPGGWTSTTLPLALHVVLLLVLVIGGIEGAMLATSTAGPVWVLQLFPITGLVYVLAGLLAWHRRPSNRLGSVMVGGGVAWLLAGLANTERPVLIAVGMISATLPLAIVVHLAHAFPSGRLLGRPSQRTVAAGYFVTIVMQAPLYLFRAAPPPYDVLLVADRPQWARFGEHAQEVAGALLMAATAVLLFTRLTSMSPHRRRVLAPLYAYGILAVLFVPVGANVIRPLLGWDNVTLVVLQLAVLTGVPLAFTLVALRGGFRRTGEVEELASWLGASDPARADVAGALARALGDDSVELFHWIEERQEYLDSDGRTVPLPAATLGRGIVDIEGASHRIGAIAYDATLVADADLVVAAGRVAAIAIDRDRLMVELLHSQSALRRSRARIVETADQERRRIAQDLHDGLQAQLVLLALRAQNLADTVGDDAELRQRAENMREAIDGAATDLRRLVHGVMPALLIERGLFAATEDLVDRLPIPTYLDLGGSETALPPAVESAAFFVLSESLTNAVRHSQASALHVNLGLIDDRLRICVRDDGVGGARAGGGAGLSGIEDRVDVLGGRLQIRSDAGGTELVMELPCGS